MESDFGGIGYFWAAVLGLVQGLTEFLPVSSSGHLALVEHLGMNAAAPVTFDVLLHLATLVVVVVFFRRNIVWYFRNDPKILFYIVVASIPAGVLGLAFKKYFEALRLSPSAICVGLLVTAVGLFLAEVRGRGAAYQLRDMGWFGALVIGLCQALAIVPGISRSGATITGAVMCGVEREEAFNFSFILSIPVVLGAVLLHATHLVKAIGFSALAKGVFSGPVILGSVLAVISGFAALSLLRRVVVAGKLLWFAAWCLLVGVAGLVYFNLIK